MKDHPTLLNMVNIHIIKLE